MVEKFQKVCSMEDRYYKRKNNDLSFSYFRIYENKYLKVNRNSIELHSVTYFQELDDSYEEITKLEFSKVYYSVLNNFESPKDFFQIPTIL